MNCFYIMDAFSTLKIGKMHIHNLLYYIFSKIAIIYCKLSDFLIYSGVIIVNYTLLHIQLHPIQLEAEYI